MAEETNKIYYEQAVTEYRWNGQTRTEVPTFIFISPKKHLREIPGIGYVNTADKRFFRDRLGNIVFHPLISKVIKQTLHQIKNK